MGTPKHSSEKNEEFFTLQEKWGPALFTLGIDVGPAVSEESWRFQLALFNGPMEGPIAPMVPGFDVGTSIDQDPDNGLVLQDVWHLNLTHAFGNNLLLEQAFLTKVFEYSVPKPMHRTYNFLEIYHKNNPV